MAGGHPPAGSENDPPERHPPAPPSETDGEPRDEPVPAAEASEAGTPGTEPNDEMPVGGTSGVATDETRAETSDPPVVLIVDDDRELADMYAVGLESSYEVRTAYNGQEAVAVIDDDVDVVLLDRRMPGMSGDEVLKAIRDRNLDCGVVMLTAVGPDLDLLGMDFDEYAVKPITMPELKDTVSRIVSLRTREIEEPQRYYALVSKRFALESRLGRGVLYESDAYRELVEEIDRRRERLDADVASRLETQASKAVFSARDGRSSWNDGGPPPDSGRDSE